MKRNKIIHYIIIVGVTGIMCVLTYLKENDTNPDRNNHNSPSNGHITEKILLQ